MKHGKPEIFGWIPLWTDKWLFGSTRHELTHEQRAIWIDLLSIANKDDGFIRANEKTAYPLTQLAGMLCATPDLLGSTISRCLEKGKLLDLGGGILYIKNWGEFQLTERYKRKLAEKAEQGAEKAEQGADFRPSSILFSSPLDLEGGRGGEKPDPPPEPGQSGGQPGTSEDKTDPQPGGKFKYEDRHLELAKFLEASIKENVPFHVFSGKNYLAAWAHEFRIMEGRKGPDQGVTFEKIEYVLRFSQADPFWKKNILSGATFRAKFGRLEVDSRDPHRGITPAAAAIAREKMVGQRKPQPAEELTTARATERTAAAEIKAQADIINTKYEAEFEAASAAGDTKTMKIINERRAKEIEAMALKVRFPGYKPGEEK